jgi:hypothetical protein
MILYLKAYLDDLLLKINIHHYLLNKGFHGHEKLELPVFMGII